MKEEWSAATVEDAVARALAEWGLPKDRVEIEVLDEGSSGFLGVGGREARVRVRPRLSFEKAAGDFIQAVVDFLGEEAHVQAPEATDRGWHIEIGGNPSGNLIGRRGDTLRALQYLAEVHASRRAGDRQRLLLDANRYRKRREETIVRMARRCARQVIDSGRPQELEPMSSYERRLVHMTLQDLHGVVTASEGEEPRRHVVIHPSSDSTPPQTS